MKKLIIALALVVPSVSVADYYHHDHHHHYHRNEWIAPAIIGGAILGSAIYAPPVEREVVIIDNRPTYRELRMEEEIRMQMLHEEEMRHQYREEQIRNPQYYRGW
jgi:hypothetical protein